MSRPKKTFAVLLLAFLTLSLVQLLSASSFPADYRVTVKKGVTFRNSSNNSTFTTMGERFKVQNITIPRSDDKIELNPYSIESPTPNSRFEIWDWFDSFGTVVKVKEPSSGATFKINTASKGIPNNVYRANSWSYSGTELTITASDEAEVWINWDTGATVRILNPWEEFGQADKQPDYGLLGNTPYTFRVLCFGKDGYRGIYKVRLDLGQGIVLQWENGIFSKYADPDYYFALDRYLSETSVESKFYLILDFVGDFSGTFSPKDTAQDVTITLYTYNEGIISNTIEDFYYIKGTLGKRTFTFSLAPFEEQGRVVAEYKDYNFSTTIDSSIGYWEFDWVRMTLAHGTDREVKLLWTRTENTTTTGYVSDTAMFTEEEDLKNIFAFNKDLCTVYWDESVKELTITFVGQISLLYPTRKPQDVYVEARSHKTEDIVEKEFANAFWVETNMMVETYSNSGGFVNDDPWQPYIIGDKKDAYAFSVFKFSKFQHLQYAIKIQTNHSIEGFLYKWFPFDWNIIIKFIDPKTETVLDGFGLVGRFSYNTSITGHYAVTAEDYAHWWLFRREAGGRTEDDYAPDLTIDNPKWDYVIGNDNSTAFFVVADSTQKIRKASNDHEYFFVIDIWISRDNGYLKIRITNGIYYDTSRAYDSSTNTFVNAQHAEYSFLLRDNYTDYAFWTVRIDPLGLFQLEQDSNVVTRTILAKSIMIKTDEMTGIDDPPVLEPTPEEDIPWWIRPIVDALRWLASALYALLKPLFDAVVNAVSGAILWLIGSLTLVWNAFVSAMDSLLAFTGNPHLFSDVIKAIRDFALAIGSLVGWLGQALTTVVDLILALAEWTFEFFFYIWGVIVWILNPALNIFRAVGDMFGIAIAWLNGTKYYSLFDGRLIADFTNLQNLKFAGMTGGKVIFAIIAIPALLFQFMFCVTRMSLAPLLAPIILVKNFVTGVIDVLKPIFEIFLKIAKFIRDLLPL